MAVSKLNKTEGVKARVSPALRERLHTIHNRHGTTDTVVIERLLAAFCDAVEEVDAVRWPAVVLLAEPLRAVAEPTPGETMDHLGAALKEHGHRAGKTPSQKPKPPRPQSPPTAR